MIQTTVHQLFSSHSNVWRTGLKTLLVGLFCLSLFIFNDYGITWDENVQRWYGGHIVHWYTSFFSDKTALSYSNLYLYGGFFEAPATFIAKQFQSRVHEVRHLLNFQFFVLLVYANAKIAEHFSNPRGGFAAACFTLSFPLLFGHSFNNSKDLVFAALLSFSTLHFLRMIKAKFSKRSILLCGITLGAAVGVRVIGGISVLSFAAFFLISVLAKKSRFEFQDHKMTTLKNVLLAGFLSFVVATIFWPWVISNPLNIFNSLIAMSQFDFNSYVLTDNVMVPTTETGIVYFYKWIIVQAPDFLILLSILFVALNVTKFRRQRSQSNDFIWPFILSFVLLPLAVIFLKKTILYDGIRHLLFIVAYIPVIGALAFEQFFEIKMRPTLSLVFRSTVFVSFFVTLNDMHQIHPYQYTYFNRLFSDNSRNSGMRYETDYWGLSYREALELLAQLVPAQTDPEKRVRVKNCSTEYLTSYYIGTRSHLEARFRSVSTSEESDYVISTTRQNCHQQDASKVVAKVERKGQVLAVVIDARKK